jgi:hypothetical protein
LGYTKGNIAIISKRANRLKQESSLQELEAIVNYVKSYQTEEDTGECDEL